MGALAVIERFDVVEKSGASLLACDEVGAINQFEFQSASEAFHGGIVVAVAFTAHGRD